MNVAAGLDRAATEHPDRPALRFPDTREPWTYSELHRRASRVATGLEGLGVRPGDRVALVMESWPEHVAAWYGIAAAGAVPVDVNYILGDEEWRGILTSAEPAAVIAGATFASRLAPIVADLPGAPALVVARGDGGVGTVLEDLDPDGVPRAAVERADDDLAVLAYTSGTTGLPKGVMHSHGLLRFHLDQMRDLFGYTPDDVVASFLPLFPLHAFLCQAGLAVHTAASLLLIERFEPVQLAEASRRVKITAGTFVPAIVIALLQMPEDARPVFARGKAFNVGGAPLHPETRTRFEDAFGVRLIQGFGSTEIMASIAMERADRPAPWGSCGELWPHLEGLVRVVDDDGNDVRAGEVGEFVVHRERALLGYWRDEERTAEAFLDDLWYRTGDIGRIDDGFVYLLDRKKDMIIRGGFNIYTAELERVLNEHEAIAEVTVIGVPDDRLGEVPVALVVPASGVVIGDDLARELRATVAERLGPLKAPEAVEFVAFDELPRNAMGKVLKRELRQQRIETAIP